MNSETILIKVKFGSRGSQWGIHCGSTVDDRVRAKMWNDSKGCYYKGVRLVARGEIVDRRIVITGKNPWPGMGELLGLRNYA